MPPKRKLRPSTVEQPSSDPAPSTSPSAQPDPLPKPDNTNTAAGTSTSNNLLNDPWTDEQEIALLKALVRWKPVGMHKHFRMISIANYMSAQPCVKPEADEHCKVPGIWEKLGQLYNLAVLDERVSVAWHPYLCAGSYIGSRFFLSLGLLLLVACAMYIC